MASVRLEIVGKRGQRLAGKLELPDGLIRGYVVLVHCFTCGKDFKATKRIARALADLGWATLRFDLTGIGESDGRFARTGFTTNVEDIVAAAQELAAAHGAPSLLVGHSLGGTAALMAACELPSVKAVALLGTPAEPAHVIHQFQEHVDTIRREGEAEVSLAGRRFSIGRQFVEDVHTTSVDEVLARLGRALLVLHSPQDATVSVENARAIYEKARHPKSFVSLDEADHLLTRARDVDFAAGIIAAWAGRYVELPKHDAAREARLEHGVLEVVETGAGKFHTAAQVGRHRFIVDEPQVMGGEDEGPTPYDYLVASLGACTSMTIRLYADRKKWPLTGVKVRLRHEKIHASDCEDCETKDGKLDEIAREITLQGDLDDEQRARLLEIADRCPVHRTLHGEVKVRTRLVE